MSRLIGVVLAASLLVVAAPARAAPVWFGDFETADLTQWSFRLNERHIAVVGDPVVQGASAGRIELVDDATWPNGLKRVELNHRPEPARTAEGAQTFFAWSFYLPEVLPAEPTHQIGYWESDRSYQQMMALQVEGERIHFATRQPDNVIHWDEDGRATAGVWHRIAMRVLWSEDPALGSVDVWFDGEQVVSGAAAKTLADDNPHFTQIGLLRGDVETGSALVIVLDDAVEGDTLEDVRPALPGEGGAGGAGTGGDGSGGDASGGESSAGGGTGDGGAGGSDGSGGRGGAADGGGTPGSTATPQPFAPDKRAKGPVLGGEGSGCGCETAGGDRGGRSLAILGVLGAAMVVRRRRR